VEQKTNLDKEFVESKGKKLVAIRDSDKFDSSKRTLRNSSDCAQRITRYTTAPNVRWLLESNEILILSD
jgi:hypothetical protein